MTRKRSFRVGNYKAAKKRRGEGGISELWLECIQTGLIKDQSVKTALEQLSVNPYDSECLAHVKGELHNYEIQEVLYPDDFRKTNPTSPNRLGGLIILGIVRHSNIRWGIDQNSLTEHLVCVGRTGGGKTTVIKKILRGILARRKKC